MRSNSARTRESPFPVPKNAVSSRLRATTKRFPSRCASTIQSVRPSKSRASTQPRLNPALLSLSAMISFYFTRRILALFRFTEQRQKWYCKQAAEEISYEKNCVRDRLEQPACGHCLDLALRV